MSMAELQALPTRRDEPWRYANLGAVEEIWNDQQGREDLRITAGQSEQLAIILPTGDAQMRRLHITIEDGARLELACLAAAPQYGRIDLQVDVASGAHFEMGGAILGTGTQTLEIVTHINHHAPDATSHQALRCLLAGKATGNFLGQIAIARNAQRIDAEQSVKSLLLDRGAQVNTKPELEIFADDVKCAHGATVGELDQAALFYLASRGLEPQAARRLMLHAFIADAFAQVPVQDGLVYDQALAAMEALL